MDDVIELALTIILLPFRKAIDALNRKVNAIQDKCKRRIVKSLLLLGAFAAALTICGFVNYLFKGYWF